jgi:hypothetical protein
MGDAVNSLLKLSEEGRGFALPLSEIRDVQVAAMNERLQERIDKIKLVGLRAMDGRITEVRDYAEVVPLLLPHTAYKSYPESVLAEGKWARMTKWLSTVSTYPLDDVDLAGVTDVDEWIARLGQAGHFVSCTSGTTGKPAMLIASQADMDWTGADSVRACAWATGMQASQDRRIFAVAAAAQIPRSAAIGVAMNAAFQVPGTERFAYPIPPITIGSITKMITLRKAIADGSAKPSEIEDFQATSAARQNAMDNAVGITADTLIAARRERLHITGMWTAVHKVAEEVRRRGYAAADFSPENSCYIVGGLKGVVLPPDYKEFIYGTFNLGPEQNFQIYGMQEINTVMPRCRRGRYHVPPWVVCLPLDKEGEQLLPIVSGEIEGRAGLFDLSMDGRWGGVISGDKIEVDFGSCACGSASPSIGDSIIRYTDIQGDDKIACTGTIDAYVKGISQ